VIAEEMAKRRALPLVSGARWDQGF